MMEYLAENFEEVEEETRVQQGTSRTSRVPLEIERTQTNFRFMVSMGIYLALWLGIAIFAGFPANFDISFYLGHGINESIFKARWIIIECSGLIALISLSYIILLRQFARVLVFATIFIYCLLLLVVVSIFLFFCATEHYYQPYLAGLIISIIISIPTILSIIVLRKKIQIAVEVIRVSSKIVVSFPSSLVFPIVPCILYGTVMIFSQRTLYFLITKYSDNGNDCIIFFFLINIFGFLWFISFITGWSQAVLSGCFCTWYWTTNKNYIANYTTISSFVQITTKYHLGTIACGSLMIILRKMIRFLLYTLGRLYILLDLLLGYEPLFGKLEKFLMCVNHNAYIMTSSRGTEFFKSAKDAFNLLMRNISVTLVINRVAEAILFLGQFLIIIISALGTYGYCQWKYGGYNDPTPTAVSLVIVSGIVITISIFMVLKIAIDSIFLCILEDNERNDGTTEKPNFMDADLKAPFLQNL